MHSFDEKSADREADDAARSDAKVHLVKVKFNGAVLVCGECERRKSGPSKFNAKDVRKEIKRDPASREMRLRVVQTGCLGMCPKKAIALVALSDGKSMKAAELCSAREASGVLNALRNAGQRAAP